MNKLIFILGITFLAACSENKKAEDKTTTTEEVVQAKHYACPMKCEGEKTYDQAGKCPVCNMDLEEIALTGADTTQHVH